MKRFTIMFLALLSGTAVFAQTTKVATPAQVNSRADYAPRLQTVLRSADEQIPTATAVKPVTSVGSSGKTSSLTAIKLGSASNAFNWIRNTENNLYCNDSLDVLAHIHRQDITIWGGGSSASGKLRYDVSIDGGATFTNDIGELNSTYTRVARYPQITGYDPGGSTAATDLEFIWEGAVLDASPDWDGIVHGRSDLVTSGIPTTTETYDFIGRSSLIPSGLCQGKPGEFWYADMEYVGGAATSNIFIHKGVVNGSGGIDWLRVDSIYPGYSLVYDGTAYGTTATMEFSPDGNDGWISMLADLTGGRDSVFSPVLWHSTDGGATWGSAVEVQINDVAWIKDSLQILWVDSLGNPAGSGFATTAFDHDITVDMNGNVHMGVVIGNAPSDGTGYSISSGLAMFMADVFTTDGGTTWDVTYLAPVLTLRGEFGGASGSTPITMDNNCQAARNVDGSKVFFTWADTDTNTVGFAESANLAPNMRGVSWRVTDGFRTCYKRFTDGDILWGDQTLYSTMAPQTLRSGSAEKMFTGFIAFQIPNDELQPTDFYTIVNDTWFDDSEYMSPSTFTDLSWDGPCYTTKRDNPVLSNTGAILHQSYPNPTNGDATIAFELGQNSDVKIVLTNIHGQVMSVIANGQFAAGMHKVNVNASDLSAGIYFYSLQTGNEVITKKMTVTK